MRSGPTHSEPLSFNVSAEHIGMIWYISIYSAEFCKQQEFSIYKVVKK